MKTLILVVLLSASSLSHTGDFCGPNGPRTMETNPFAQQFCAPERMGGARAESIVEVQAAPPEGTESGWLRYTAVFAASFVFGGALGWRILCGKTRRLASAQGVKCGDIEDVEFTERRAITLG